MISFIATLVLDLRRPLIAGLAAAAMCLTVGRAPVFGAARQQQFASPEEAAEVLIAAIKADDTKDMLAILGAEAKPLIESGDPVADRETAARVVTEYDAAHSVVKEGDGKAILQIGTDNWPFPIPIVMSDGRWHFDTPAGKQEILDRRIGRNELSAIEVCLAYVDAQREYYARNPQNDTLLQFAQKMMSGPGKRDGLYWDAKEGEALSPLGPLVAHARGEGYSRKGGKPIPYHGYYYRILTGQGPDATGGAYDYVAHGKMIGGFGLVAYPAEWGTSGVMTFIVNHDGNVHQKDLGPKTASIASAMTKFNPDVSWTRVEQSDESPAAKQ